MFASVLPPGCKCTANGWIDADGFQGVVLDRVRPHCPHHGWMCNADDADRKKATEAR